MEKVKIFLPLLLIIFIGQADAQTIVTDRPDQTESSSTVEKGSFQIESGFLFGFEPDERQILAPSTLFRYGAAKWLEIRLLSQFESNKDQESSESTHGISDLEIGFKLQLFRKEDRNIETAFLSHVIFPTGSNGISSDKFGTINKLSISHVLCEKVGIGYNVGYNYFGTGKGDFTYSLAFGFAVSEKAAFYIEQYADVVEFDDYIGNFDAGFTYLIKENFQLDFSFGTGLNHTMNYISTGFSWNIKPMEKYRDDG